MARRRARIVRPPRIQRDIVEIATYIGQESPASAGRFVAAVERTVARLADHPLRGSPYPLEHPELAHVRMVPVVRFRRYLIFYRVVGSEVQLLRVIHGVRDIPTLLENTTQDRQEEMPEP
jgi:toxin ParE1/3/4